MLQPIIHHLKDYLLLLFCSATFCVQAQHVGTNPTISLKEEVEWVKPIDWSRFEAEVTPSPQQILMGKILLNANKYALTTWWEKRGFSGISIDDYLDLGGVSEHKIRPVAAEAEALAASLQMGLYDGTFTGVSKQEAEAKTVQMIRSLVHTHLANKPGGWGEKWQSALWAGYTSFAAWMMWPKLDEQTRLETLAMITTECAWIMDDKELPGIKTYRDLNGEIISPGDTGGEENAWDSLILTVACAMMPESPEYDERINKVIWLTLNALARPSDLESRKWYNGKPLHEWLVGTNLNEDGTVVNHHFIHPDYMTSPFEFNPIKYFWLADQSIPTALKFNIDKVFSAFADLRFGPGEKLTGGQVKDPGGTIFKEGSGDIFYPLGTDWGKGRRMNFSMFNSIAASFTNDSDMRMRALDWELKQGQVVLDMQSRFEDGHTYLDAKEDSYASREEWVADKAMTAYIIETLKLVSEPKFTNKGF
ncbi:hypothetical protein FKX85_19095 [Echinicola soli]|uniref:Uncharacterized protein n=1 Tax=Echinicola soli TaxID=2591634 RepID=A0A514CMJ3_9BACT|nr:hypothetical protein [Echinicola soli]QDH81036.1 hypothetical protein FKX85_19095 [Echinicola soli]